MTRSLPGAFLAALFALSIGCSGPSSELPPQAGSRLAEGLPSITQLDALRGVSSAQLPFDVTAPVEEDNTSIIGSSLGLGKDNLAYAIYRIQPPLESVLSIAAGGSDGLYLLVADYARGLWSGVTEFSSSFAVSALDAVGNPLSPQGYIYCAVVAPPGVQGLLTSLALNFDGPEKVYFVADPASGGDDTNPGSAQEPWATLQKAADTVGPDSLVIVRSGTYDPFTMGTSGNEGAPIIFKADQGVTIEANGGNHGIALLTSNWITIDGFKIQNAFGFGIIGGSVGKKSEHNTLRNNLIRDCQNGGFYINNTDHLLVEGNNISHVLYGEALTINMDSDFAVVRHNIFSLTAYSGIGLYYGADPEKLIDNALVTANYFYANTLSGDGCGILGDGLANSVIANNQLVANFTGIGLLALNEAPSTGNQIVNNTIVQASYDGPCVLIADGCTGNMLFNNILFCDEPATGALEINTPGLIGFLSDNNIMIDKLKLDGVVLSLAQWQSITLRDTHSQVSQMEETFVGQSTSDCHLLPDASAVDAALADYSPADDYDGVLRPQGNAPDCGCYELPAS